MAAALKLLVILLCTAAAAARDIPAYSPTYSVAETVEVITGEETVVECWEALKELTACSNEILVFLINGVAKLAPPCCAAVETITHGCWPAMLTAAGISAEEGNILRGYCDKEVAHAGPATSPVQYSELTNTTVTAATAAVATASPATSGVEHSSPLDSVSTLSFQCCNIQIPRSCLFLLRHHGGVLRLRNWCVGLLAGVGYLRPGCAVAHGYFSG